MVMVTQDVTKHKKIKGAADKNGLKTLRVNEALRNAMLTVAFTIDCMK